MHGNVRTSTGSLEPVNRDYPAQYKYATVSALTNKNHKVHRKPNSNDPRFFFQVHLRMQSKVAVHYRVDSEYQTHH